MDLVVRVNSMQDKKQVHMRSTGGSRDPTPQQMRGAYDRQKLFGAYEFYHEEANLNEDSTSNNGLSSDYTSNLSG